MVNSALPVLLFCCLKFFSWWIIHPRGIGRVYQVFISNLCGASQSNMSLWNSSPQQSLSFEKIKPKKMFCLFFEKEKLLLCSLSKKKKKMNAQLSSILKQVLKFILGIFPAEFVIKSKRNGNICFIKVTII